jgi:hypothetical protein
MAQPDNHKLRVSKVTFETWLIPSAISALAMIILYAVVYFNQNHLYVKDFIPVIGCFLGMFIEAIRTSTRKSSMWTLLFVILILSLIVFARDRGEYDYDFGRHLFVWPFAIMLLYGFIGNINQQERSVFPSFHMSSLLLSSSIVISVFFTSENIGLIVVMGLLNLLMLAISIWYYVTPSPTETVKRLLDVYCKVLITGLYVYQVVIFFINGRLDMVDEFEYIIPVLLSYFSLGVLTVWVTAWMVTWWSKGNHQSKKLKNTKPLNSQGHKITARQVMVHTVICFALTVLLVMILISNPMISSLSLLGCFVWAYVLLSDMANRLVYFLLFFFVWI